MFYAVGDGSRGRAPWLRTTGAGKEELMRKPAVAEDGEGDPPRSG